MTATPRKRTADDNPYDFNLDAVQAEVELKPFRMNWAGKRWSFTHALELDMWDLIEAADLGDLASMAKALEIALGSQQKWDEFRKIRMPQYKMKALWEAYQRHSGMEPGESQRSTDS